MNKFLWSAALAMAVGFVACKKDNTPDPDDANLPYSPLDLPAGQYRAVDILANGTGYVVLAAYTPVGSATARPCLIGVDDSLQVDWNQTYGANTAAYTPVRLLANNSGYWMVCNRRDSERKIEVFEVDANGGLITSSVLRSGENGDDWANDAAYEMGTPSILIVGGTSAVDTLKPDYASYSATDTTDMLSLRLATDLSLMWSRTYGFVGQDQGLAISPSAGDPSRIDIAGSTQLFNGSTYSPAMLYVAQMRSSGNIINMYQDSVWGVVESAVLDYNSELELVILGKGSTGLIYSEYSAVGTWTTNTISGAPSALSPRQLDFRNGHFYVVGNNGNNFQWLDLNEDLTYVSHRDYDFNGVDQVGRAVFSNSDFTYAASIASGDTLVVGRDTL